MCASLSKLSEPLLPHIKNLLKDISMLQWRKHCDIFTPTRRSCFLCLFICLSVCFSDWVHNNPKSNETDLCEIFTSVGCDQRKTGADFMWGLSLVSGSNFRLLSQIIVTFFLSPWVQPLWISQKGLSLSFGWATGSNTETGR